MINKFLSKLKNLGFSIKKHGDDGVTISLECCPFWSISLHNINDDRMRPIFYIRKRRIEEVTDLHEMIPTVLASITKCNGNSSFRFLGEHNEFSGIDDELYGMYWFPAQPLNEGVRKNSKSDLDCLFRILFDLYTFHMYQGDILGVNDIDEDGFSGSSPELESWVDRIVQSMGEDESYVANLRKNPNWFYFRSFSASFSVCKSTHIAKLLKGFSVHGEERIKKLNGVESNIQIDGDIYNSISYKDINFVKKILKSLDDSSDLKVIPQDNQLVFVTDEHVIIRYTNSGLDSVNAEKELIRVRQQQEIDLLFGSQKFVWNISDRSASAEFEDLVLELLNRESWVFSGKKVAPTNQGDNGRDLICEYNMLYNEYQVSKDVAPVKIGKMIIQCKTNLSTSKKSSVGKSDVDLADTIFHYRPDGYMLVVNTQITRDLTEMLERQKERQEQNSIVWWNAFDVEDRLRKHPDILARYKNLVGYA